MDYKNADMYALMCERDKCAAELAKYAKSGLSLDLSRGKPSAEQLALSLNMLDVLDHRSILDSESGQDCRNYGGLDGIEEAKRLLSHMMGTHSVNTIVGGNSSLTMMYELVSHGMTDGICGAKPWQEIKNRKFLCPAPGYDRHFAITGHFGFELIPVGMTESGPDMDEVEELIKDETVKGIWCVPKYQNPTGIVFSPETVRRFAALKPAAEDFRIFWDNAYCIQLRHARFFKNSAGLRAHMKKHAEILKPKFEAVYKTLKEELGGVGIADWTTPRGGYFLSFNTLPGCAKKVVEMCGEYGVKFTPAGASFPYGYDPEDKNIRLAPSFATVEEITQAIKVLCLCTKLAAIEKLMKERT